MEGGNGSDCLAASDARCPHFPHFKSNYLDSYKQACLAIRDGEGRASLKL
jgi:hypothetical protein